MEVTLRITAEAVEQYGRELVRRERSQGTVRQYVQAVGQLLRYLPEDKGVTTERLLAWKEELTAHRAAGTVNWMIAAVNGFLTFAGAPELRLRPLKCQRRIFSEEELTDGEFQALLAQAEREGDRQLAVLLEALSGTGMRVSEVRFLTVEAARQRLAVVRLKGKTRQVPLGDELCARLLRFAGEQGIVSGPIFVGKGGKPLDRRRIWERMKRLCPGAGVDPQKVHPHAFRHLFARMFYGMTRDIAKLADLLGHSSIDTTRIYITTSCQEHRSMLNRLVRQLDMKKTPGQGGGRRKKRARTAKRNF